MHLLRLVVALGLLCATGCALLPGSAVYDPYRLPPEEAELSRSLAHFVHGLILELEGGPRGGEAAVEAFGRAAALNTTNSILGDMVVERLWLRGQREEALEMAQAQCKRTPSEELWGLNGRMAEELGQYKLAADCYAKAAAYRSEHADHWCYSRIRALVSARRDGAALRALCRVVMAEKEAAQPHSLYWGRQLVAVEGESLRAKPYFKLALSTATNHEQRVMAYEGLAVSDLRAGATNTARRYLQRAVAEAPSRSDGVTALVRFELATRGWGATNEWQRALDDRRRPDLFAAQALSLIALQHGDREGALRYATVAHQALLRGHKKVPEPEFYSYLGSLYDEFGEVERAEALLEEALQHHPDAATLLNHLAYFLAVHNRRLREAEGLVRRALLQEPENGAYLDTLGWVLYRKGDYGEALNYLMRAAHIAGNDPTILDHIGDTCLALGRRANAIAFWQKSLKTDPKNDKVRAKLQQHGAEPLP